MQGNAHSLPLPDIGMPREALDELGMDDTTAGDRCMVTSFGELIRDPLRPRRCREPAVARAYLDHCPSMECAPWKCKGHPTCQPHLDDMVAVGQLDRSEPMP